MLHIPTPTSGTSRRSSSSCRSSCSSAPARWSGPSHTPSARVSSAANPRSKASLSNARQQALAARHLDLASIKTLKQRIQRPRATQVLHSLTPTSASHNNIIIHHASILSNKRRIHRQLNTPRGAPLCVTRQSSPLCDTVTSAHTVEGSWVFRTVCFERVVLSSPGCLWPGRMDDHEEVFEAHA